MKPYYLKSSRAQKRNTYPGEVFQFRLNNELGEDSCAGSLLLSLQYPAELLRVKKGIDPRRQI